MDSEPPFLRLPAELRTEIYGLVLGNNVIHIGYPGCPVTTQDKVDPRTSLCHALPQDEELFNLNLEIFTLTHKHCLKSPSESIDFNLLLVCRKLYGEARFTVFQTNRFTVFGRETLGAFLERLNGEQRKAIQNLLVYHTHRDTSWSTEAFNQPAIPQLHGLRHLEVRVNLCEADFMPSYGETLVTVEAQDRRLDGLIVLQMPTLKRCRSLDLPQVRYMAPSRHEGP